MPALEVEGQVFTQSPAIIEWLEERFPTPPLLPLEADARAHVRALAAIVGCDVHPVNNRRILEALRSRFGADAATIDDWCGSWITAGFHAFDALAAKAGPPGPFAYGETPTLADVYLIPQIESARRFKVDLGRWPRLLDIEAACGRVDAFRLAAPALQPDGS